MKSPFILTVCCLLSILCFGQNNAQRLTPKDFKSSIDTTKNAVVLDVRTNDEVKNGVIEHAKQIDYFAKDFESQIASLDKNKSYFVYCASGQRSAETVELMTSKGFKRVYDLDGGFNLWKKQKFPIVPLK
jgi:phage shock protein E